MKRLSDQDLLKLHDLLDALVENNLPKSKVLELEEWILENEEVRKHYIEFMDMSSSLHHFAEELVGDDIESEPDEKSVSLVNFIKPVFAVAAIVVFGFFFSKDIDSFFQEIRAGSDSSIDDFSLQTSQENEIIAIMKNVIMYDGS